MKIKLKAFPVIYYTAWCTKHQCHVALNPQSSKDRTDTIVIGGRITSLVCQVGGGASASNCVDNWELTVSGSNFITVEG